MPRRRSTKLNPAQLARRGQIGEERRARMRGRLLGAAYRLFAIHGSEAPSIDDVTKEAGVARGTFYNYFKTCDELFRAVADDLARSINSVIRPKLSGIDDPAARISLAFRMFIHFAVSNEARGWILLRTMPLVGPLNLEMKNFYEAEFEQALSDGRFKVAMLENALDLSMGFMIMTIRRLLVERGADNHIDKAAEIMLVTMGLKKDEARRIAAAALDLDSFPALADPSAKRGSPSEAVILKFHSR